MQKISLLIVLTAATICNASMRLAIYGDEYVEHIWLQPSDTLEIAVVTDPGFVSGILSVDLSNSDGTLDWSGIEYSQEYCLLVLDGVCFLYMPWDFTWGLRHDHPPTSTSVWVSGGNIHMAIAEACTVLSGLSFTYTGPEDVVISLVSQGIYFGLEREEIPAGVVLDTVTVHLDTGAGERVLTMAAEPNTFGAATTSPRLGDHTYAQDWQVPIAATASFNLLCPDVYEFDHWQGDVADANSAWTSVIMDSDKTVTAIYAPAERVCGDECHPILKGDLNEDCYINFLDFAMYCELWLVCTHPDCD